MLVNLRVETGVDVSHLKGGNSTLYQSVYTGLLFNEIHRLIEENTGKELHDGLDSIDGNIGSWKESNDAVVGGPQAVTCW